MNYLKLGTIIKTRGLKGQVKVYSTTEFAYDRYEKGAIVFLENPETRSMKEFEVESYSNDGQFDYLTFKGYNTIESITPYIRHDILISKEENPLPEGLYYHVDLINCDVYDDNKHIGSSNVRQRLKMLCNGTLNVESTLGVGTTVLIKIPKTEV